MWEFLTDLIGSTLSAPKPQEPLGPPAPQPRGPEVTSAFKAYDQRETDLLAQLHPYVKAQVQQTLLEARNDGLDVFIFEGLRTWERQAALYAEGRDKAGNVVDKKKVRTNAKPGSSFHQYALAVDLVFKVNGQWSWDGKLPWAKLGKIGMAAGLRWYGVEPKFVEMPHFQLKSSLTIAQLRDFYLRGGLKTVWLQVDLAVANS